MTTYQPYPYGPWQNTPQWLQFLGKPQFRRAKYWSWMVGGGFDYWEYADRIPRRKTSRTSKSGAA